MTELHIILKSCETFNNGIFRRRFALFFFFRFFKKNLMIKLIEFKVKRSRRSLDKSPILYKIMVYRKSKQKF